MNTDREIRKNISHAVDSQRSALAREAVERQYARFPESLAPFGERGKAKSIEDAEYNLQYLAEAMALGDRLVFVSYILWLKDVLAGARVPSGILIEHLHILRQVLADRLPPDAAAAAGGYIAHALTALEAP